MGLIIMIYYNDKNLIMDGIIYIMRSNDDIMISLSYNRSNNGIMIIYIMIYYNVKDNDNIIRL